MTLGMKWKISLGIVSVILCLIVAVALLLPAVGAPQYCYSLHDALRQPESVKKLALVNQGLIEVPEEAEQLASLSCVELFGNKISQLPRWLTRTNIVAISLDSNQFSTFPPELTEMAGLRSISLSHNSIADVPESIGKLVMLEHLELGDNKLKVLPQEVGHLKALVSLGLRENRLRELPREIGNLHRLEGLDLSDNHLTDVPEEVSHLIALEHLWVGGNRFSETAQERLRKLLPHTIIDFGQQQVSAPVDTKQPSPNSSNAAGG
jgi:Leucine-rich repeat (LRR) protein